VLWALGKLGDNKVVPALEKQLKEEANQTRYARINEDMKRLVINLKR
jgi:hypothetical protein